MVVVCHRADPGRLLHHHVVEVDEVLAAHAVRGRGSGEEQQVAYQPFHLVGVPQQPGGQTWPVVLLVRQRDLELRAQGRDRALQLVGGVSNERPLPTARVLEPESIWFMVSASRLISSSAAGTGTLRSSWSSPMAATSVRMSSTGRSVRPMTTQVPKATSPVSRGTPTTRSRRNVWEASLTDSRLAPANTVTGPVAVSAPITQTR